MGVTGDHSISLPTSLLCRISSTTVLLTMMIAVPAAAHDTWVEVNTGVVRAGEAVYIDLKLGNHGNEHRDFKLAGKVDLADCRLQVLLPNGTTFDMADQMHDIGYAPREGYWTGKFVSGSAGTHLVSQTSDQILNHGRPVRALKSAKCFFLSTARLDRLEDRSETWKKPLGHPLEIIPISHPLLTSGPGMPVQIQVLRKGQPKAGARVSFIPQGVTLKEGFDETFERMTDSEGRASFTPTTGGKLLIVTHERAEDEKTADYELTAYSATLFLTVSEICPCCQ